MFQSFIGYQGVGGQVQSVEQAKRFRREGLIGAPNKNVDFSTLEHPQLTLPSNHLEEKLVAMHRDNLPNLNQIPMYRTEPWRNAVTMNDQANGFSGMRLYATDPAREVYKNVVHGYSSRLVPEGQTTQHQEDMDRQFAGMSGLVSAEQAKLQQ